MFLNENDKKNNEEKKSLDKPLSNNEALQLSIAHSLKTGEDVDTLLERSRELFSQGNLNYKTWIYKNFLKIETIITNNSIINSSLMRHLSKLEKERFNGIVEYQNFLTFICDIGRLDILYMYINIDFKNEEFVNKVKDNQKIKHIFSFSIDDDIYVRGEYSKLSCNLFYKTVSQYFWKYFHRLDPLLATHKENMTLSYLLYLLINTAGKESLDGQDYIKIFHYFDLARNCNSMRKNICVLTLIDLAIKHKIKGFFVFRKQYYNHVNKLFYYVTYNNILSDTDREMFLKNMSLMVKSSNNLKISYKKRIAVCISGKYRNHQDSLESIKKNIIVPLNADVFVHSWDEKSIWSGIGGAAFCGRIFGAEARQIIPREYVNLLKLESLFPKSYPILKTPIDSPLDAQRDLGILNSTNIIIESESEFINSLGENISGFTKARGSANQIKMFYGIKRSIDLALEHGNYDYIIRCRPDWLITKEVSQDNFDNLLPNTFYGVVENGVAFSDALFCISGSMALNFSRLVDLMLEKNIISPFDEFPLYDAHNIMTAWLVSNGYSYRKEFIYGHNLPNPDTKLEGLAKALRVDFANLDISTQENFKEFIEYLIQRNG